MVRHLRWCAVALLAVVSCSNGGDEEGAPSSTTSSPSTTPPSSTEEPTPSITDSDLETILIPLEDLPTGWSEDLRQAEDVEVCGHRSIRDELPTTAVAEATFRSGDSSEILAEGLAVFADGAETAMAAARARYSCESFDAGGEVGEVSIAPASFPDVGDDSFAFRLTAVANGIEVAYLQVVWSRGPIVASIQQGAVDPDIEQLEDHVQTLDARIVDHLDQ